MHGFDDVDLGNWDSSTQDGSRDTQNASRLINDPSDDARFCDPETTSLGGRKPRVPSEEAYQQAFLPFRTDAGTPHPCGESDLDVHNTGAFREPNNAPFISVLEATREVMLQNHVTRRVPPLELTAIDNLKRTVDTMEKRMDFGPDLAIKAFADLDLVFFGGRLRNNVRVQWVRANDDSRCTAPRRVWGLAITLPERGKCLIKLNADALLRRTHDDDPLRSLFGTLLHEMCHAYSVVRCGSGLAKRRGHDEFFGTRIAVVHKRAVRVLGLWAIREDELYRQYHFFPGEQTAAGMVAEWVMDVVLDVDDTLGEKMDAAAETSVWGIRAVKRWMGAGEDGVVD